MFMRKKLHPEDLDHGKMIVHGETIYPRDYRGLKRIMEITDKQLADYRYQVSLRDQEIEDLQEAIQINPDPHRFYQKYIVLKSLTGEVVEDDVFVLNLDRDPTARDAIKAYAEATQDKALAELIRRWLEERTIFY
jgi:hypothetical protein